MILEDKFQIIQNNHIISDKEIDNYLENLILKDQKLFSSNLIHNYLIKYFDDEKIIKNTYKIISNNILKYLRNVINDWRKMKNKLTLEFINLFSKEFLSKFKKCIFEIPRRRNFKK